MQLKLFRCILFLYLSVSISFGQGLKGKVYSINNEPVINAIVRVLNAPNFCYTDSVGNYYLPLNSGTYSIEVKSLGYASEVKKLQVRDTVQIINFSLRTISNTLSETVVTANKREEELIKIPASVTYLSAEKVQQAGINELSQLASIVPNYQYGNLGVGYQQQIALRGISVFSENPAVATYIDGVCALDITANGLQLFDIERIEVLRGPQGTLYGRNAMGGVINIITKAPTNKLNGFAESTIGNQGIQRYGFGIRSPLIKNKLFIGFAGQYQRQNGFYFNDLSNKYTFLHQPLKGTAEDGVRMGDEESIYGNLNIKWLVSPNLHFVYNAKTQYEHSLGASAYYQAVENDSIAKSSPYKFAVNTLGSNSRKILNQSLSTVYYHKNFTLHSISTYQLILQAYDKIDQDLTPYNYAYGSTYNRKLGDDNQQNVWSQEVRISSSEQTKKLTWTTGVYGFYQQNNKQYATVYDKLAYLFGSQPGLEVNKADINNVGVAIFGQATYEISKRLALTGGLRYDLENRQSDVSKFRINESNEILNYTLEPVSKSKSYTALSPKAIVQYKINEHQNVYGSYTRGFRAGGINMYTSKSNYNYYQPEFSDNYEVGYKLLTPNKKIQFNSSFFGLYWQNLQLDLQPEPGIWITSNVGNVSAYGAEFEVNSTPLPGFQVDAAMGINHSRYLDFNYLGTNIKDNQTIFAPSNTIFIAAQQLLPLPQKINMLFRMEWRHIGEQYFDLVNKIYQEPYNLFNGRITTNYKQFYLSIWCQNIFDIQYLTYAMPGYFRYSLLNRPRTFGVTLNINLKK